MAEIFGSGFCDNERAVAVVNLGFSKVARIMHLLRCLFFIRARFNLHKFWTRPGVQNTLADAISCDKLDILFSQVSVAQGSRVSLPRELVCCSVCTNR